MVWLREGLSSILFCLPLYLLPRVIGWYAASRGAKPVLTGLLGGGAIGAYLIASGYVLFGRVFVADVLFQLNLIVSAFVYAGLVGSGILPSPSARDLGATVWVMSAIQMALYAGGGAMIGWLWQCLASRAWRFGANR